jgi:two-component system OmpR family sensor kinase
MEMNEKERLIDLLIHDLTGSLSVVSTSVSSLLNKTDQDPLTDRQKRILERILRNSRKAQSLLQEMLEIARSEEGLFQKEIFPIEKTLKESILDALEVTNHQALEKLSHTEDPKEFQNILKAHWIFIDITGKYCKFPFCHDQRKVQQILRNLISNALKYRRKRMDVSISGEVDLVVSVEDDGYGIPQEEQEAIFKRFVRLNNKTKPDLKGLGLGLTGVKALVKAMGGEITLESREGSGTRFMVRIPPL